VNSPFLFYNLRTMKPLYRYLVLFLALPFAGCNDNIQSSIPDYPVYLELNLTSTYPTFRNSYNKSLTFIKGVTLTDRVGYGGILAYTGFDGSYYAFDMACPYEAKQSIRVHPNDIGQAVCEKCGSVFDIGYGIGNPSSGPAKEVLKRYHASLSGDILYITR